MRHVFGYIMAFSAGALLSTVHVVRFGYTAGHRVLAISCIVGAISTALFALTTIFEKDPDAK
jgi:hypothetical protein